MSEGLPPKVVSFEDVKSKIIQSYNDKIAPTFKCPMCSKSLGVDLIDGFTCHILQDNFGGNLSMSGTIIPQVGVICKNCGNVQYYAYMALVSNIEDGEKPNNNS